MLRADLMKLCRMCSRFGKDALLVATLSYNVGYYRLVGYGKIPKSRLIQKLEAGDRNIYDEYISFVSIRPTTGIKPLYTTIATVTMNLIVSAAIVLLNPYVTVYISYKIPPFALSVHIPDVSTSIYVEVDSKVLLGLPFCDKAFVR